MLEKFSLILLFVFLAQTAAAQETPEKKFNLKNWEQARKAIEAEDDRIEALNNKLDPIETKLKDLQAAAANHTSNKGKLTPWQQTVRDCIASPSTKGPLSFENTNKCTQAELDKVAGQIQQHETELARLQPEIEKIGREKASIDQQITALVEKRDQLSNANLEQQGLKEEIDTLWDDQKLETAWQDLKDKFEAAEQSIIWLEQKFDHAALGYYFREKFQKLLTSKTFCEAAKQCSGEKPAEKAKVDSAALEKEVFLPLPGATRTATPATGNTQ